MVKRIFWGIFGCGLGVLFLTMIGVLNSVYQSFFEEQLNSLHSQAFMMAQILNMDPDFPLEKLNSLDIRITLIDETGKVLSDSIEDPYKMDNHLNREEIIQAQQNKEGFSLRSSSTLNQETYNLAIQLENGNFLRLSYPHSSCLALWFQALSPLLLSLFLSLLLSLAIAYFAAQKIVEPINSIDPNHPRKNATYEQLTPLLDKLEENRKQIEKQLTDLERKNQEFALLSEYMDEGLILLGLQDSVLFANKAALALFPHIEKTSLNDLPFLLKNLIENAKQNGRASTSFSLEARSYHLEAHAIENQTQILGVLILILDVSEREEIKKRRQEFTANVTHELKTPLQTILAASELLENGMVSPLDQTMFAKSIHVQALRMIKMINDIIHLSRLDSFGSQKEEMVSLEEVIKRGVGQIMSMAKLRNISIDLNLIPLKIQANPSLLDDIVSCLLENAVLYNKENGWIHVSLSQKENEVILKVCDGGIGIDPAFHQRIFERFYTVDNSHSHQGTGLGLAIVWHAVELIKGRIHVESKLNEGSCFEIILPLSD